ncbi:peptidoglycan DD-metalloendopeptidase family protein [Enterovirga aerilata]|uniref:M23 family metallopeptidase n=1 Tax=Enterovirga aerilata TaxID=2730920 RepID=A0A849I7G4_9HYPH|nr:M23 family metallopeptidase [Enterovirga sp. DB1703]NNM71967.1 M23 family metallopeptidase [Enterovirga sp. DB1703]
MRPHASPVHRHAHRPAPAPGTVLLSRRALLTAGFLATSALAWAAATTWYIASRDELAQRVFVRETEMRFAYEDRIAQLSARLEREVTGNMVERRSFEARIAAVAARQAEIESRQAWLRAAAEQAGLTAASPALTVAAGMPERSARRVPAGEEARPAPLLDFGLRLRDGRGEGPRPESPRDRLSALERKLEATAAEEAEISKTVGRIARQRLVRLRSALDATGLDLAGSPSPERDIGGPLVPVDVKPGSGPLGFLLSDLGSSLAEIRRLDALARTLPLGQPLAGEVEQTSGFGTRFDPFTRGPALHTGLDFRAEPGTPARATGDGRVVSAEYSGGYGNMVELDHGNGVTTRYGHLMSIAVTPGQRVQAGQIVGLTGSTGRSTGPHLHYETRVGGEPVNPVRFIEAGRLSGRLNG